MSSATSSDSSKKSVLNSNEAKQTSPTEDTNVSSSFVLLSSVVLDQSKDETDQNQSNLTNCIENHNDHLTQMVIGETSKFLTSSSLKTDHEEGEQKLEKQNSSEKEKNLNLSVINNTPSSLKEISDAGGDSSLLILPSINLLMPNCVETDTKKNDDNKQNSDNFSVVASVKNELRNDKKGGQSFDQILNDLATINFEASEQKFESMEKTLILPSSSEQTRKISGEITESADSNSTEESTIEGDEENKRNKQEDLKSAMLTSVTNHKSESVQLSQEYHLKWIKWKNNANKVAIVTQNSNGSCPLLAIINVLLLRNSISFPPIIEIVTASQLMDYLCDCILNSVPENLPENVKLNYEQNVQDAMSIMPRLETGLDVNVKFTGIFDFEYTPECDIFDLLRIPLYHGWLVDPKDKEFCRVVNSLSYNQLVDKIIASKFSPSDSTTKSEMFLAEEFLRLTASQLTYYGLSQLIKHIKEENLCILFRNNHFITLYKYKGKLYQLVTDQGFLTESNVVWESLNNIEGDTYFVDGDFALVPPKPSLALQPSGVNTQQQIDHDYLIALGLEEEQKLELQRNPSRSQTDLLQPKKTFFNDEELAKQLQAEEDQLYEKAKVRQQKQQSVQKSINKTYKNDPPKTNSINEAKINMCQQKPCKDQQSISQHSSHQRSIQTTINHQELLPHKSLGVTVDDSILVHKPGSDHSSRQHPQQSVVADQAARPSTAAERTSSSEHRKHNKTCVIS